MLRNFSVLGLCNALNGICVMFANPYTPGFMQSLLSTMIVPSTLIFSVVMLSSKFSYTQLGGVILILLGQLLQVAAAGGTNAQVSVFWAFVFTVGQLPMAFCAVFQQKIFSSQRVNILFMLAWTNIFQFLWLTVLAPLAAVTPGFGSTRLASLAREMSDAWLCTQDLLPDRPECGQAMFWMFSVFLCMVLGMFLQTWIVKVASAALAIVASTLVTPISALCFTSPILMGQFAEQLAPSTWTSLVVILIGLVLYRLDDMRPTPAKETPVAESLIGEAPLLGEGPAALEAPRPKLLNSRVGIVESEFDNTNPSGAGGLLFQHTIVEQDPDFGCCVALTKQTNWEEQIRSGQVSPNPDYLKVSA